MKSPGQIVLFQFPQTAVSSGKLRPALLLAKVPGQYDDWLICMISSQLHQHVENFDEIIRHNDADFHASGLKRTNAIRIGRLAVAEGNILLGSIGKISATRLNRIKTNISNWLLET